MSPIQRHMVALLGTVLIGYGVYWFFDNFERVEQERYVGLRGEAARNPLLAAQRYFTRLGHVASSHQSVLELPGMPPPGAVLIDTGERLTLGRNGHAQLLEWVAAGGHLIAKVRDSPSEVHSTDEDGESSNEPSGEDERESPTVLPDDPLLQAAGLTVEPVDPDWEDAATRAPIDVELPGATDSLLVEFYPSRALIASDSNGLSVGSALGYHLISKTYGRGRLTLMTDTDMFGNRAIGDYDHAAFLARMVSLHGKPSAVWLIYGDDRSGLGSWLWSHARQVLLTLAALVLLWLVGRAQRFGPVLVLPSPDRRRITEHIAAAGEFYWRHGQVGGLLAETRAELGHRLETRYPELRHARIGEQVRRIAELTGLPVTEVGEALQSAPSRDAERYTAQIRGLQLLRKRL
jgi:hypothetical protein